MAGAATVSSIDWPRAPVLVKWLQDCRMSACQRALQQSVIECVQSNVVVWGLLLHRAMSFGFSCGGSARKTRMLLNAVVYD